MFQDIFQSMIQQRIKSEGHIKEGKNLDTVSGVEREFQMQGNGDW